MRQLKMSDGDRAFHEGNQGLAIDANGMEILTGLTREESEWLIADSETWLVQRMTGRRDRADRSRYLELADKHEVARLRGIGLVQSPPAGTA
ncbi:hypothetical protein ACX0GZ_04610 [Sphingomonas aestuarii]